MKLAAPTIQRRGHLSSHFFKSSDVSCFEYSSSHAWAMAPDGKPFVAFSPSLGIISTIFTVLPWDMVPCPPWALADRGASSKTQCRLSRKSQVSTYTHGQIGAHGLPRWHCKSCVCSSNETSCEIVETIDSTRKGAATFLGAWLVLGPPVHTVTLTGNATTCENWWRNTRCRLFSLQGH